MRDIGDREGFEMTSETVRGKGLAGLVGGAAWVFCGFGALLMDEVEVEVEEGSANVGLGVYFGLTVVLPAVLMIVGVSGLQQLHGRRYGRLGSAGATVSGVGLTAVAVGLGWETLSIAFRGEENAIGFVVWTGGLLVLVVGSAVLGVALWRAAVLPHGRAAGVMLGLLLPAIVAVDVVAGALVDGDAAFWLAVTLPYGLAWLVLGSGLRSAGSEAVGHRTPAAA